MKNKVIIGGLVLSMLAMSACSNVPGKTENAEVPNVEESIAPEIMEDIHGDTAVDALLDKTENGSTDSGDTNDAIDSNNSETADAGSDENIETSPMFLWDYEGYIDEAKGYTW